MKRPLVSIIIPTRNSAQFLDACLKSILGQTYKPIEIIVVDQESQDDTQSIAQKYKATVITLPKPRFYSPPTRSRNAGAKASYGDILYHLDSDMELTPDLIEEAVEKFSQDKKLAALVVHEQDRTQGYWSKCKALERKCYWGNDKIESARVARKKVFLKVGGYDEAINSGEDFDIHRRYKQIGRVDFCSNVVFHNLGSLSFRRTIYKKYNYGKTAKAYFLKHKESGSTLLAEQLKSYLKHFNLFISHPIIGSGSLVLKFSEFLAGALGALVIRKQRL